MFDLILKAAPPRDRCGTGRKPHQCIAVAVKIMRLECAQAPVEAVVGVYPGVIRRVGAPVGSYDGDAGGLGPTLPIEGAQPQFSGRLQIVSGADFETALSAADRVLQNDLRVAGAIGDEGNL